MPIIEAVDFLQDPTGATRVRWLTAIHGRPDSTAIVGDLLRAATNRSVSVHRADTHVVPQ